MSRMYPKDLEGLPEVTDGERQIFRRLKGAPWPEKEIICWYRPSIRGMEPDFVLYVYKLGILILEVKDWSIRQIEKGDPHQFTLVKDGKREQRENPDKQAKHYVNALMGELKKERAFLSGDPVHAGELKVPVGRAVAFPNISFKEFREKGLDALIPMERALFEDDLSTYADLWYDPTGDTLRKRLSGCTPFPFEAFTPREVEALTNLLWREIKLELPGRLGIGKDRFEAGVQALDERQARLARRLGEGHHILKGPPGSGKSVVLVHRCYFLHKYHRKVKRILLVCYNIALVSYLKRLVQEKGLGVGDGGIEVCHFFELVSRITDEPVQFEKKDSAYYDETTLWALEILKEGKHDLGYFDAILVDEGQDFSDTMFKALLSLIRPGGSLVIALDPYQDLYRRKVSWKSLGIEVRGRSQYIRNVYRNTAEIFEFTQRFIGEDPHGGLQPSLLPEDPIRGDPPCLRVFPDADAVEAFLIEDIKEWVRQGEYKRAEIAIIYDDKNYGPQGFQYAGKEAPRRILRDLERAAIPVKWVSEDVRAKEMFDVTTDRVSLISIHSAKGLDFDLVYLIGADRIQATEGSREQIERLFYVAMTRAKHRLVIPYVQESEFMLRMQACLRS